MSTDVSPRFLSPHFTLDELCLSQAAVQRGLGKTPPPAALRNVLRLVTTLERVRDVLGGHPVVISSGYRSPAVNKLVGGAASSAHVQGLAADFVVPRYGTPLQVCQTLLRHGLVFDQLIYEGSWVHLGLAAEGKPPRQQALTAHFAKGKASYSQGIAV